MPSKSPSAPGSWGNTAFRPRFCGTSCFEILVWMNFPQKKNALVGSTLVHRRDLEEKLPFVEPTPVSCGVRVACLAFPAAWPCSGALPGLRPEVGERKSPSLGHPLGLAGCRSLTRGGKSGAPFAFGTSKAAHELNLSTPRFLTS